ncbi:hypothetical protein Mal4_51820 [Maioricimonas rarisocia]|uniref:Secreted protein n=1 Tax=Maioricimonas rarisocia TaxID=2528026 RepID=A0A517ZEE0_9PLAN|nr:hypothetical protein [Maioricimonas rarisocia]QDU40820.1 hypothetical protein Mal4_51820 [Maioricimonas rarisocia]
MTASSVAGSLIKKSTHFAVTLTLVVLFGSTTAHAASLEEVIEGITTQVASFLGSKNETAISIGAFDGPPTTGTGRKIASDLKQGLENAGLTITDNALEASFELRGEFRQNLDGPFPIVALTVKLFDNNGAEVTSFRDRFRETNRQRVADTKESLEQVAEQRREAAEDATTPETAETTASATDDTTTATAEAATSAVSINDDEAPIDNPDDVETLTSPTVDVTRPVEDALSGDASGTEGDAEVSREQRQQAIAARDKALLDALANPKFHLDGESIVAASEESPFRVEVLAKPPGGSEYLPVAIQDKSGLAFAPLQEGELYAIRIYNDADFDVGVELTIDGLNTLAFSELPGFKETGKWVIRAHSSGTIKGYHVSNETVDTFQIAARPTGPVQDQLANPDRIGTVLAAFHVAWPEDQTPPLVARILGQSRDLVTVRGPRIDAPSETVQRVFCQTAVAFVGVRYLNPKPD